MDPIGFMLGAGKLTLWQVRMMGTPEKDLSGKQSGLSLVEVKVLQAKRKAEYETWIQQYLED